MHDLKSLVLSLAFWYDKKLLYRDPKVKKGNRIQFRCQTCNSFVARFHCSNYEKGQKGDNMFLLVVQQSTCFHGPMCVGGNEISSRNDNFCVLNNCQELLALASSTYYQHSERYSLTVPQVVKLLNSIGKTIQVHRTTINRHLDALRENYLKENFDYYTLLPSYLERLTNWNPKCTIVAQSDDEGCFYRLFCSIPEGPKIFEKLCVPVYHCDGTFSSTPLYDGILFQICARDGNGGLILLAFAWVPSESSFHLAWIILQMVRAGYDVESYPFVCDRGHLSAASILLKMLFGILIPLFFCLEHILRNVYKNFNVPKQSRVILKSLINSVQSASTIEKFEFWIHRLVQQIPRGLDIAIYLMQGIHPRHWTVFGNRNLSDSVWEERYYLLLGNYLIQSDSDVTIPSSLEDQKQLLMKDKVPISKPHALFGNARNNLAESSAYVALSGKVRSETPPKALPYLLLTAQSQLERFRNEIMRMDGSGPFTNIGAHLYSQSMQRAIVSRCTVESFSMEATGDFNLTLKEFIFNHEKQVQCKIMMRDDVVVCTPCHRFDMYQICYHCCVALTYISNLPQHPLSPSTSTESWTAKFFPCYMNRHQSKQVIQSLPMLIYPPYVVEGITVVDSAKMDPPPSYRVKNNSIVRRLLSQGELPGEGRTQLSQGSTSPSPRRITFNALPISRQPPTRGWMEAARTLEGVSYFDLTNNDVTVLTETNKEIVSALMLVGGSSRKIQVCSACGDPNAEHISRRHCLYYLSGKRQYRPNMDIFPGQIVFCHPNSSGDINKISKRALVVQTFFELLDNITEESCFFGNDIRRNEMNLTDHYDIYDMSNPQDAYIGKEPIVTSNDWFHLGDETAIPTATMMNSPIIETHSSDSDDNSQILRRQLFPPSKI